jgi:hypothetical protein
MEPAGFEPRGLAAFRASYPRGKNYVVSPLNGPDYVRERHGMEIRFMAPEALRRSHTRSVFQRPADPDQDAMD